MTTATLVARLHAILSETLKAGDLVYIDSFAGLVPAKITYIEAGNAMTGPSVTVKVTAKRRGFRRGEEITYHVGFSGQTVIARRAVYTMNHQYRIRQLNYTYEPTKGDADV